jgi:osmotically-inducible protein OsmY
MGLVRSLQDQLGIAAFKGRLLAVAIFLTLLSPCLAADIGDWLPVGPPPDDSTAHDLELTLRAREALLRDPELRRSRLGVNVFHRRATLWGEVTTPQVGERARQCLQRLVELQEIREEWHVIGPEAKPDQMPLRQQVPPGDPVVAQSVRVRGALVGRPDADALAPGRALLWQPLENRRRPTAGEESASLSARPEGRSASNEAMPAPQKLRQELGWRPGPIGPVPKLPDRGNEPAGSMALPIIRLAGPTAAAASLGQSAVKQPESNQVSASPKTGNPLLTKSIESLRSSHARFVKLRVELKEGIAFLSGAASHWEDVYDLARAIARLPGVQRVELKDIQAGS